MSRLGIVTGMASETACLQRSNHPAPPLTFCAGGSPGRAEAGARELLRGGATALISFGIAGGLDPALRAGDIVLARSVVAPTGDIHGAQPAWIDRIAAQLGETVRISYGSIVTVSRPVGDALAKRALRRTTGAAAVDMESSGVARVAAEARIPFIAIRAVADTADRSLPKAALAGLAPDGSTRPIAVLVALVPRPWEIAGLAGVARASAAALRTLRRVAALDLRLAV